MNNEAVETGLRVKPTRVVNVDASSPYGGVYGCITMISIVIVNECALRAQMMIEIRVSSYHVCFPKK